MKITLISNSSTNLHGINHNVWKCFFFCILGIHIDSFSKGQISFRINTRWRLDLDWYSALYSSGVIVISLFLYKGFRSNGYFSQRLDPELGIDITCCLMLWLMRMNQWNSYALWSLMNHIVFNKILGHAP